MAQLTDAELRCRREYLGVTMEVLAALLGLNPLTVRDWEHGEVPVPADMADKLDKLERQTDAFIEQLTAEAHRHGYVTTYRGNPELAAHVPGYGIMGAAWHRRCAEVVSRELGVPIRYPSKQSRIAL